MFCSWIIKQFTFYVSPCGHFHFHYSFFLSFFWGNETNSFNSRTLAHQNFKFLSHSFTSTSTSSYSRGSSRKFKRTTATTMSSTIKNYSESLQVHNSLFICCCRFNKWKFMDDNIFFTLWRCFMMSLWVILNILIFYHK